jgi:hypothetical protein
LGGRGAGPGDDAWPHRRKEGSGRAASRSRSSQLDSSIGALNSAIDAAEIEAVLNLAAAMFQFWYLHGYYSEGIAWLSELMAHPEAQRLPLEWLRANLGRGLLATHHGRYPEAQAWLAVIEPADTGHPTRKTDPVPVFRQFLVHASHSLACCTRSSSSVSVGFLLRQTLPARSTNF